MVNNDKSSLSKQVWKLRRCCQRVRAPISEMWNPHVWCLVESINGGTWTNLILLLHLKKNDVHIKYPIYGCVHKNQFDVPVLDSLISNHKLSRKKQKHISKCNTQTVFLSFIHCMYTHHIPLYMQKCVCITYLVNFSPRVALNPIV